MLLLLMVVFLGVVTTTSFAVNNVTYDHRALVIDGKRRVLVSGSIHYPRSTPEVCLITRIFGFLWYKKLLIFFLSVISLILYVPRFFFLVSLLKIML